MNKNIKYLIESFIDDEDETAEMELNIQQYIYTPETKQELIENIVELLKSGETNLNVINVSNIDDMSYMFTFIRQQVKFTHIDISEWNVSHVQHMRSMFKNCNGLDIDVSKWDVSNVKDMVSMFENCKACNVDTSKWKISKDCATFDMFKKAYIPVENVCLCQNLENDIDKIQHHLDMHLPLTINKSRIVDKSGHITHLGEVLAQLIKHGPTPKKELWELCGFPEGYYGTWWSSVYGNIFMYIGSDVYFPRIEYWA